MTETITSHFPAHHHRLARLAHAVRRERVLVLIASGPIGLHIADDNFLQPRAGHVGR